MADSKRNSGPPHFEEYPMTVHIEQLFAKASECHEARLWTEAEALYLSILHKDPHHAASLHRLGLLAHQIGDYDRAVSLLRDAISHQPGDAAFHGALGGVLLALGRQAEALESFERAVSLDPGAAMVRNNFAYVLHALGFSARALSEYEQALKIAPDNWGIRNNFAQILSAQGQLDLAIENFRRVIASAAVDAEVYANLANALCAKGMFDEAVEVCTNALKIDPRSVSSYNSLGKALAGLGRFGEAADAYRMAIGLAPNVAELHKNLGIALHRLKDWDAARASFETAARIAPNDQQLRGIAETYSALSQMQSGVDIFQRVLHAAPDAHPLHAMGNELNALGFLSLGLECFSKGYGMVGLALAAPRAAETPAPRRIDMNRPSAPNFIGGWMMTSPEICDRLVAFFEANVALQTPGRTGSGVNSTIKRSIDVSISPKDLGKAEYAPLAAYVRELESCLHDYGRQWPHLSETLPNAEMGPFNIQKYHEGGHFQLCHHERVGFKEIHRVLAWMTYLNDVEGGGETSFPHFDLAIKPERGKTVIWPAEWTHAHRGEVVTAGTKYVVTGWLHFPHPRAPNLLSIAVG